MGSSAVAIGVAGFSPIDDLRGRGDLFGRPMRIKRLAVADDISSAAQLVMGETSESMPVALVRGAPVQRGDGFTIDAALIPWDQCLIMHLMKKHTKIVSRRHKY
jgi:F420-0:gamma-glutamyl ligase